MGVVDRGPVEHAGSCSLSQSAEGSAYHGRRHRALVLFRLAAESFGSVPAWTHERVSAADGRPDSWGTSSCCRLRSGELPSRRGLSPVALTASALMPGVPQTPPEPLPNALALAQRA